MIEKFKKLKESTLEIRKCDWGNSAELGETENFVELNQKKEEECRYLETLITRVISCFDSFDDTHILEVYDSLKSRRDEIASFKNRIDQVIESKRHNQFLQKRTGAISDFRNLAEKRGPSLSSTLVKILLAEQSKLLKIGKFDGLSEKIDSLESRLRSTLDDAQKKVDLLNEEIASKAYEAARTNYSSLSAKYAAREVVWLCVICAGMAGLATVGIWTFFHRPDFGATDATSGAIIYVFERSLAITFAVLLLRIGLTKYNAERHLRVTYDHRQAATDQIEIFESSVKDETKAILRLEAAKMLLSDPSSSYNSKSEASDVNISPFFSSVEKFTGGGNPNH